MRKYALSFLAAFALALCGWSVGRAQTEDADFMVMIDAPVGHLNITCVRGCDWDRTAYGGTTYFLCGGTEVRCQGPVNAQGINVTRLR